MIRESIVKGHELQRDPETEVYYLRVLVEGLTYSTVNNLHRRIPLGRLSDRARAESAAERMLAEMEGA